MAKFISFSSDSFPDTRVLVEDILSFGSTDDTTLVIHLRGGKKITQTIATDAGEDVLDLLNGIEKCMELSKSPHHEDRALVTTITLTNAAEGNAVIS